MSLYPEVGFKRIDPMGVVPTYGSVGAIGADLYALEDDYAEKARPRLIRTGIALSIPPGYYGRIAPRSGLAAKHGIHVLAGVIDSDYRGEIKVCLQALGDEFLRITAGDRIAQIIFERADTLQFNQHTFDDESSVRGACGFGSTGV